MGVADELREYTERQIKWLDMTKVHYRNLFAIADRIDAEHQKAVRELNDYASGSILLPRDADGKVIHIGDKVTRPYDRCVYEVVGISFHEDGASVTYEGESGCGHVRAKNLHHYHEPTVDDLLFSYGQACICASNEAETDAAKQTMLANLRHEYAAKLRMAGDGKEQ